ncbi:MAG: DUF4290 domain-containing protein [Bacteroidales bacterium]|nr:DUF4290 domain-containing protein [Bacteroidales bacterium]MCF8327859.1 DUF4290 domain-containing protein [Bacteroidales bacterium]
MEYNTEREELRIPEYGRNIQKMVHALNDEPDRDKRTQMAKVIVKIMAQVRQSKDAEVGGDLYHKLWDHLFIISDFTLDVDSPYPMPSPEILKWEPEKLERDKENIRYRYFGRNIQKIIKQVAELEEGEQKETLINSLANHLKKLFLIWNKESVDDEIIFKQMEILSEGKIKLTDDTKLNETRDILARANVKRRKSTNKQHQKNYKNNNRKKRY